MVEFPKDFEDFVTKDAHLDVEILSALNGHSPISIRTNPHKLSGEFHGAKPIPWCENGVFLLERPVFTLNPLFHAGSFYPQEAGSMLLDYMLRQLQLPTEPTVLDLCAAPGGKSTLIASFLDGKGLLVANEVINQRAKILKENISKWGYANTIVTNNDPADFQRLTSFFDVAVVDAPCSGEGMFRKDPNARTEWSLDNVNLCAGRQKRILADVWSSIKEGGYLIYSTCTFNSKENEENVQWMESELGGQYIHVEAPNNFVQGRNGIGICGIPGKSESEGFYIAVVQKFSNDGKTVTLGKNANKGIAKFKDEAPLKDWLAVDQTSFYAWNELILGVPKVKQTEFLILQSNLHIVKWGVVIGELARKGLIPDHDLLMCHQLRAAYSSVELDTQQALHYLKGETFTLPSTCANGFVQITHEGEPLGWIKNIGNRFNNLYPKEYRIRMRIDS